MKPSLSKFSEAVAVAYLEPVLGEKPLIDGGGHVEEGVAHAEQTSLGSAHAADGGGVAVGEGSKLNEAWVLLFRRELHNP